MGTRGPVPKPVDKRLGHRSKAEKDAVQKAASGGSVKVPNVSSKWHPVAKRWFNGLKQSGQSVFYEQSDWETAYLIAESISRELKPQPVGNVDGEPVFAELPVKGASLAAWLKAMTGLLVTEGDRRRLRLELQSGSPDGDPREEAAVVRIDSIRTRLVGNMD